MQRRDVLKLGTLAVLVGPGAAFAAARRERADVIVIGSGGAGMTAAITAFDAKGVKVVVLEKMPITGGNTQLAAGGMNAAETVFQDERKIEDAVDIMYNDTIKGGKHLAKPELVEILAKN